MVAFPNALVMVFCKAPIPGQVKTRLIPPLTGEEAAQLHCELAEKTLKIATQKHLCEVQLWCTPTIDDPFFDYLKQGYGVNCHVQQGADLGYRMHFAFTQALARYSNAVIIGCDCPSLTRPDLEEALTQLSKGKPCVIAPAEDGGYVLIGLNLIRPNWPQPQLFENMPWGTDKLMAETRERLRALGLDHFELNTHWDLDTPQDLERYLGYIG